MRIYIYIRHGLVDVGFKVDCVEQVLQRSAEQGRGGGNEHCAALSCAMLFAPILVSAARPKTSMLDAWRCARRVSSGALSGVRRLHRKRLGAAVGACVNPATHGIPFSDGRVFLASFSSLEESKGSVRAQVGLESGKDATKPGMRVRAARER